MNAKTLKALKASIAHWERMAMGKAKRDEWPFADDCALCGIFNRFFRCHGCPVMEHTKQHCCRRTPWENAVAMYQLHGKKSTEFQSAAHKELDFLKSLLP